MGSSISPVIANIFMEHFEKEALQKAPKKPEVWFCYVNDKFVIWRHSRAELHKFLISSTINIPISALPWT